MSRPPSSSGRSSAARVAVVLLAACAWLGADSRAAATAAPTKPPSAAPIPAGEYTLDKAHASLIFKVNHLGFSHFTARFTRFDASLQFDPKRPVEARVDAAIDPRSIQSDNAPPGFLDMLRGPEWLDAAKFPQMSFRSTGVARSARHCACAATSPCTA